MTSESTTSDVEPIEVAFPEALLDELDQYRASEGYPSRSAVVARALEE